MSHRDLSLTSLLSLSKEVLNVYKEGDRKPKVVEETEDQIVVVKSLLEQLDKQKTVETPPDMLKAMSDIMADLDRYLKRIVDFKSRRGQETARYLRFVPVLKPVVQALGPAFALYMAMMPTGTWTLLFLLLLAASVAFLRVNPRLATDLADAWNDKDNNRFARMQKSLEHHATQLRRYIALQEQMRASRRYDVSKTLTDEAARKFWITHFGAENHSVDTSRFIETLLFAASDAKDGNRTEYKDDHRRLIYSTIEKIVDNNKDGSVSPYEFGVFLRFFGPLEKCCDKVVNSLINLNSNPPSLHAWFCWRSMDRKDVNENLPKTDGTFVIRTSSQPDGKFAISYVANRVVHHSKIVNDPEHGYHFEATPGQKDVRYFPDLHALVAQYSHILKVAYRDPNVAVKFNASGQIFETRIGCFFRYPNTLLGEMFSGDERAEGPEVFFDRDPAAFQVILNWYRYGRLMIPSTVPVSLIREELKFFRIPVDVSEAESDDVSAPPRVVRMASDHSVRAPLDRAQTRNSPPGSPPDVDSGDEKDDPKKPRDKSKGTAVALGGDAPNAYSSFADIKSSVQAAATAAGGDFSYAAGTGAGAGGANAPSVPIPLQRPGSALDPTGSRKRTVASLVAKALNAETPAAPAAAPLPVAMPVAAPVAAAAPAAAAPAKAVAAPDPSNYGVFSAGAMDDALPVARTRGITAQPAPAPAVVGAGGLAVDPERYKSELNSSHFSDAAATPDASAYGVLPAASMEPPGAAAAGAGAAAAAPAAAVAAADPLDIDVESKPYWWAGASRDAAAGALKAQGAFLFRACGDPGERIDGKPNPNLFVMSYLDAAPTGSPADVKNMKVFRFPGEGLGQDRAKNCTVHRNIDALARAIMGPSAHGVVKP